MMNSSSKTTVRLPTDILWAIVTRNGTTDHHSVEEYEQVIKSLYPGITIVKNRANDHLKQVLLDLAEPDLKFDHPELMPFKTDKEAVLSLGKTLEIQAIRPCNGNEWMSWTPGF